MILRSCHWDRFDLAVSCRLSGPAIGRAWKNGPWMEYGASSIQSKGDIVVRIVVIWLGTGAGSEHRLSTEKHMAGDVW